MKQFLTILLLLFLLQGCSSTPEKQFYFSADSFASGTLVIPPESSDDEIDDELLETMNHQYKNKRWHNLAMSAFNTLNPQDLTYFYLGSAAEGLKHYKSALNYYNRAILAGGEERTCQGVLYDDCNELNFPSDINKAIARIDKKIDTKLRKDKHDSRPRNVTINVDRPNAFFIIGDGNKFQSPNTIKLTPGKYNVRYYTDKLFAETIINITKDIQESINIQLEFKEDSELSFSIDYLDDMNTIGKEQLLELEKYSEKFGGTIHNVNTMDDFPLLISQYEAIKKQIKAIETIYDKLDKLTSLYKTTQKNLVIYNQLLDSITNRIVHTKTEDFFEYNYLVERLIDKNISFSKVPLYNNAQLGGRDLYSAVALDDLNCKSYVVATKGGGLSTGLIDSKKSQHSSQYIQEYRDVPNSRYSEYKSELRDAKYELEDYDYSERNRPGFAKLIRREVFGIDTRERLQANVNTLQSAFNNTPRIIREEIKGTYNLIKNNITFNKIQSFEWVSINCDSGQVNTYKVLKEENEDYVLYEGTRSDDQNSLPTSNEATKDRMRQWSSTPILSLNDIEQKDDNLLLSSTIINNNIDSIRSQLNSFLFE
jgi:hypothetical protein